MAEPRSRRALAAPVLLLLAACAVPPPEPGAPAPRTPAGFPMRHYLSAIAQGEAVYAIVPASSLAVATVRRGGPLAKLGHDHVVASHDLEGYVEPASGTGDLFVPLTELDVDEAALRQEAKLDTTPGSADIAATLKNLHEKVLESARYPYALVHLKRTDAGTFDVSVTLHGVTHVYAVPAQVVVDGDELRAEGAFELRQSDFGITPFSILGGGLRVEDALALRFSVQAHRIGD